MPDLIPVPVIAIVGAGASHASGTYANEARPPLTKDLFKGERAEEVFRTHRLAQKASRIIARDMRADSGLALEKALRALREDGNPQHAQMAFDVPLYLQELLLGYSRDIGGHAERYDALVDELLKLSTSIHFVSLNYDVLLDNCLSPHFPLREINDYVVMRSGTRVKNWSLIKPHGSINWFVEVAQRFDPRSPEPGIRIPHGPISCLPSDAFDLNALRGTVPGAPQAGAKHYPSLALPEGSKDRLTLPAGHLHFFKSVLQAAQQVDLLVLGYSAVDTEVLALIKDGRARVRRMTIVNKDAPEALKVLEVIEQFGIDAIWPDVFDGSFADWVDRDGLRAWGHEFGGLQGPNGPYPSLTPPRELAQRIASDKLEQELRNQGDRPNWLTGPM